MEPHIRVSAASVPSDRPDPPVPARASASSDVIPVSRQRLESLQQL
jgi:hypothetical protein